MKYLSLHHTVKTTRVETRLFLTALSLACILAFAPKAHAAPTTICVGQHGETGCLTTITAAVADSAPGVTIHVHPGTYHEDVVIGKSISLVGDNPLTTIIDAMGLSNAVYVDGIDNPGLSGVIVTGFTLTHGNFEGILVTSAAAVTIFSNIVRENDRSLQPSLAACPGLPAFETMEQTDCGQGVHLIATTHSSVADNFVFQNAGGILISDELAATHDNLINRNLVLDNNYASGISLESHPAFQTGASAVTAFGLYNNTVSQNDSVHNGFGPPAAGAGVLILSPGAGNIASANQVLGNRLVANATSGVAIRTLASVISSASSTPPDASRNEVANNYIARNGADPLLPTSLPTGISVLGVSPVLELMVENNVIEDEGVGLAVNSASTVEVHLNDFLGLKVGIASLDSAVVDAKENWWGCVDGPGTMGCSTVVGNAVTFLPWLTRPIDPGRGHGFDRFFDLLHDWDFDHNRDCDLSRFFHRD